MSSRTRTWSAYQSALTGGIIAGTTSFSVDSASGLNHPAYLVIDPDDAAKREYIKVGNISGTTFSSVTRGLSGSAGGAVAHDAGAVVRAILTHHHINDLWDDIEALVTADSGHFGGTDTADHPEVTTSVRGFMSSTDKTKLDTLSTSQQVTNGNSHDHLGGDGGTIAHSSLSGLTSGDPHTQYREMTEDHTHASSGTQAGTVAHSVLTGLTSGDPHTQYLKEEASGGTASEVPDHTHASGSQAGTVPHANLTSLTANDHTQYLLRTDIDWQTWSPTLTNLNVGSTGTVVARYVVIPGSAGPDIVVGYFHASLAGTGVSVGSGPDFTLPVNASSNYVAGEEFFGTAYLRAAGSQYVGWSRFGSGNTIQLITGNVAGTYLTLQGITSTIPGTWAAGDDLSCHFTYESS